MTNKQDTLYNLLPVIYRRRDKEQGEPLRALMAIMEQELQAMHSQIDQSYINYFVETCQKELLPFIGDLLAIPDLHNQPNILQTLRRRIANTIRYRRHKGQAAVVEHLIKDSTIWSAKLVEYYKLLGITQTLNNLRLDQGKTANIRDLAAMDALNTAFETVAHTAEVRNLNRQSRYMLDTVGVFVWRLKSYPVKRGYAKKISNTEFHYTFDSLGKDIALFSQAQSVLGITERTTEINLSMPIGLTALQADLKKYQKNYANSAPNETPVNSLYYGPDASIYIIKIVDGEEQVIPASKITITDLSAWSIPVSDADIVFVDPSLGRIALPTNAETPDRIEVNYYYGFGAELGGGHYYRNLQSLVTENDTFTARLSKDTGSTIASLIAAWVDSKKPKCVIEITDDAIYNAASIEIDNNTSIRTSLTIQAANDCRPILIGDLVIENSHFTQGIDINLNGITLEGKINLKGNTRLSVQHSTLVPIVANPSIIVSGLNNPFSNQSEIIIENSISGPLHLTKNMLALSISDSIIDGFGHTAIAEDSSKLNPGPQLRLERSTVFGSIYVNTLTLISESIITKSVLVNNFQVGQVRYSYLPLNSQTPSRYRCQPEQDLVPILQEKGVSKIDQLIPEERDSILKRLAPRFINRDYSEPYYAQLSDSMPNTILNSAENTSEIGVYHKINRSQLQRNIQQVLNEYMPNGDEAFIEYVTAMPKHANKINIPEAYRIAMMGDIRITQDSRNRITVYKNK